MRKTYKPLARAEKDSQMFKRKTLNVNDDLNIKHDDDNIENVDAYWSTAMSVIGNSTIDSIDNEKSMEPCDTLFNINNIRKSIQGSRAKVELDELYRHSVNEGRIPIKSVEDKEIKTDNLSEIDSNGVKPGNNNDLNDIKDNNNETNLNNNDKDKLEKKPNSQKASIRKIYTEEDCSGLIRLPDPVKMCSNKIKEENYEISNGFDMDFPTIVSDNETNENHMNELEKREEDMALKTFQTAKSLPAKKKTEDDVIESLQKKKSRNAGLKSVSESENASTTERTRIEAHKPRKQRSAYNFEIEDVVSNQKNNTVFPLICSVSVDVATMTLDYLAYIEKYKTENAFSIYVIKGKIELTVDGEIKTVTKGKATLVEKNSVYSINCISKNGAVLLLTYAL